MLPIHDQQGLRAKSERIPGDRIRRGGARCAGAILRLYLAVAVSGCATAPPPSPHEVRRMETRTIASGFFTTIRAITDVLQDQGYTVDAAEAETGIMSATKETTRELAEITEEPAGDSDGLPVWQQVLIVAAVVPILIWLITRSDNEDESQSGAEASLSSGSGERAYCYRLTFSIEPRGPDKTHVRLSAQGSQYCDGSIEKAGPIHDAEFFAQFFDAIQAAIPPLPVEDED